jgi:hypothetical protein
MMSDVVPPFIGVEDDDAVTELRVSIPSHVPEPVALKAREWYAAAINAAGVAFAGSDLKKEDAICDTLVAVRINKRSFLPEAVAIGIKFWLPLLCAPEMKRVWDELSRHRKDGTFLHPAVSSIEAMSAEERQGKAMAELFETAVKCRIMPGIAMTRQRADQRRNDLLEKAHALRAEVTKGTLLDAITFGGERNIMTEHRQRRLMNAADELEGIAADTFTADMSGAVERDRHAAARWFARIIGKKCRILFGSPLYRTTATITSVALGCEINWRSVCDWCDADNKSRAEP